MEGKKSHVGLIVITGSVTFLIGYVALFQFLLNVLVP